MAYQPPATYAFCLHNYRYEEKFGLPNSQRLRSVNWELANVARTDSRPNLLPDRFLLPTFHLISTSVRGDRWGGWPGSSISRFRTLLFAAFDFSQSASRFSQTGPCENIQEFRSHLKCSSNIPTLDGRLATLSMSCNYWQHRFRYQALSTKCEEKGCFKSSSDYIHLTFKMS